MKPRYNTIQSLPNIQTNHLHQINDDEIDLIEIIILLWKEKIFIFATILAFLIPTFLWVFTKPPVYAIDILIDNAPSYNINSLQPSTLIGGDRYQVQKLDQTLLFQRLTNQLETLYVKKLFWQDWSKKIIPANSQIENIEIEATFEKFSKGLKLTKPDPKKTNSTIHKITLTTTHPTDGVELLSAYSDFLNRYMALTAISQMEEGYKSSLLQLKADYDRLIDREQEKLNDRLIQLSEQLELARSLNIIETPYEKLTGIELKIVDNRLYLLGTKALEEEIKALKIRQEKQPSVFVSELRNMEHWQKTMEDDVKKLQSLKTKIDVFEIVSPPVSSLDAISPKKVLIITGVLFLSLILGAVIALIKNGIKNYKTRVTRLHPY